jgi:hypothetical protein
MSNNYVNDAIAQAAAPKEEGKKQGRRPRKEYTPEEIQELKSQQRTTGRKNAKSDRLNFAVTPENLQYVQIMSRVTGDGMSAFINKILDQHRRDNAGLYEKAVAFKKALEEYEF